MQITRKILTALLLLPIVVLSAQDMDTLTDGMGRILTDGMGRILVSSGPVNYPNDGGAPGSASYYIVMDMTFETEDNYIFKFTWEGVLIKCDFILGVPIDPVEHNRIATIVRLMAHKIIREHYL